MTTSKTAHMTDYEAERRNFHLEVPEYFNFKKKARSVASEPTRESLSYFTERS